MAKYGVLFVDDDENVLKSLNLKLASEEYEKYFANSVDKAIEILTLTNEIYVVVSDLAMPEVSGEKLFEYLNKYYPDIEKVVLSVHSDSNTVISILNNYHVAAYIKKPWKYDAEFIPVIRSCIQKYISKKEERSKLDFYKYEKDIFESKQNVYEEKLNESDEIIQKTKKEKEDNQRLVEFIVNDIEPYLNKFYEIIKMDKEDIVKKIENEKDEIEKKADIIIKNFQKVKEYIQKKKEKEKEMQDRKILIIDDSKENRQLLASIIQSSTKYKVIAAKNGYDVIKMIGKVNFDEIGLILLDIMMPGIDGYKLAEMLKKNQETKKIPIIFISAMTDIRNMAKAFEKGGYDYIKKPINREEVIEKIEKHIH